VGGTLRQGTKGSRGNVRNMWYRGEGAPKDRFAVIDQKGGKLDCALGVAKIFGVIEN